MIGYFDLSVPKGTQMENGRGLRRREGRGLGAGGGLNTEGLAGMLKGLDANHDGKISRDEVPPRFQDMFDRISGGKNSISVEDAEKLLTRLRRGADRS